MNESLNYMYIKEKLFTIIKYLATANGSMRERLKTMSCELALLEENAFPEDLKKQWKTIENKLYKYPAKFNGDNTIEEMSSIEHSLKRVQEKTACKIASDIFELWENIQYISFQDNLQGTI